MVWFYHKSRKRVQQKNNQSRQAFNPTMVWFYPIELYWRRADDDDLSIPLWSDFIFLSADSRSSAASFQSHYGLILSWKGTYLVKRWYVTFNPTMVWFYPPISTRHLHEVFSSFNPTMVWFYRKILDDAGVPANILSIPLWSDFILT